MYGLTRLNLLTRKVIKPKECELEFRWRERQILVTVPFPVTVDAEEMMEVF